MTEGTYEFAGDGALTGARMDNWGLIRKSAGTGTATLSASLVHHGGSFRVDSGTLSLNSQNYVQGGGSLSITIGGTNAGQWGQLTCGTATLGGPLNVTVSNGVVLLPGTMFPIVAGTNRTGFFSATNVPAGLAVAYTGSGAYLTVTAGPSPELLSPRMAATNFTFGFQSYVGQSYTVMYNEDLNSTNWWPDTNMIGNGGLLQISLPVNAYPQRFYRVRQP